jgi:hypothetical protein
MAGNEQAQVTTDNPVTTPKRNWARDLRSRMGVLGELFAFLWKVKLWWLIPMVVVLLVFIIVFVFLPSTPLAPFIYSLH